MLGKLTQSRSVDADDMRTVLAAGASREQIEDALAACLVFNITGRLADAFDFDLATHPESLNPTLVLHPSPMCQEGPGGPHPAQPADRLCGTTTRVSAREG